MDLSGCWTDTPPITYEHGGAVLTAAINLNGKVRVKSLKCINSITTRPAFYLSCDDNFFPIFGNRNCHCLSAPFSSIDKLASFFMNIMYTADIRMK